MRLLQPLLLLVAAALPLACSRAEPRPPHLILITADTLRADHLSFYGYPRATSPRIDAFAAAATAFDQALTVIPKTGPSFTTMFTGRHPQEHGVRFNFTEVPPALPVLAERLQAAGYRTAAFLGNPVLRASKRYDRGFDVFESFSKEQGVEGVKRAFLDWAAGDWDQPTFVWVHFMDPHGPYDPIDAYEQLFLDDEFAQDERRVSLDYEAVVEEGGHPNKILHALPMYHQRPDGEDRVAKFVARYDAEIRYVDDATGELLDFLGARGLFDSSAIVFTSDHGESLGENGYYFEHGWFADEATLHIPLFLKVPGQRTGERVDALVSTLDYAPTFLELAGLPPDPGAVGQSLLHLSANRPPLVVENSDEYPEKYHGLRTEQWKYLRRASDGHEELYDLAADPTEVENLAARKPELVGRLREALEEKLAAMGRRAVAASAGLPDPPEVLEALRDLGY